MPSSTVSNLNETPDRVCPRCANGGLDPCETTTAIWHDGRPFVIEEIPALRCVSCDEILIDRDTAEGLKVIARELATGRKATRRIEVPVVSYRDFSV